MKKFCDYCNKEYKFENHIQWMSHRGNCKFSPKFKKKYSKVSEKLYSKKEYKLACKCGTEYILLLTEKQYELGKYRKHCGISCANKRKHSVETVAKIMQVGLNGIN